jgi:proline dehydrogenase
MEDSSYVDRTLQLYRTLRAKHERIGVCLQSYLFRTPQDLEGLLPTKPWIRLVKGAYAEPAAIAHPVKRDNDLAYYDLALKLLDAAARGSAFPVFGTHDLPLLERILGGAHERGLKRDQYEVHMLYGIRTGDQRALVQAGHRVRTLISYGHAWF